METKADKLGRMLNVTTDLFMDMEQALFYRRYLNDGVSTVLDIGCGNGAYMARLGEAYRDIRFTGVELDEAMYRQAVAKERDGSKIDFVLGSYESLSGTGPYDAVILRLVAAHIRHRGHLADWLADHTHKRSIVIVIDFDDRRYGGLEELPLFSALYKDARRSLKVGKRTFLELRDALPLEFGEAGFVPLAAETYSLVTSTPEQKKQCRDYMRAATEYMMDEPITPNRERELTEWLERSETVVEIPMFGIVFGKGAVVA